MLSGGEVLRYVDRNSKGKVVSSKRVFITDTSGVPNFCEVMDFDDETGDAPEETVACGALQSLEPFESEILHERRAIRRQLPYERAGGGDVALSASAGAPAWLSLGKAAGNTAFTVKDYTAAADVYQYLLTRLTKQQRGRIQQGTVVLVRSGKKAVRGLVVREVEIERADSESIAADGLAAGGGGGSGGGGGGGGSSGSAEVGGGGSKDEPIGTEEAVAPRRRTRTQKAFAVLWAGGEKRVPKRDIVAVVADDPEVAEIQVVLHLNIARCLLEQRDQLDKAEWHCFMAMTLHPMGANASEVGNRAALEETEQEQEQEGSMRSLVSSVTSKITSMFSGSGRGSGAAEAESVAASGVQASAGCSQPDTAAKSQKLFAKILFFRARVLLARKKFQRAITFAEKALALDPGSRPVRKFIDVTVPREKALELKTHRRLAKQISLFVKDAVPQTDE